MKKLSIVVGLLLASFGVLAQGTLNFSNGASGVNAPATDIDGTTKLAGAGFTAALYAGPQGTAWNSLTAIATSPFATGANAGYFFAGSTAIPGVAAGSIATVQIRVWTGAFATWDAAYAAYLAGNPAAKVGVSGVAAWTGGVGNLPTSTLDTPALGGGANPTPNMLNLKPFQLYQNVVPEPSTIALGVVGAAALLLRRRK